MQPKHFLLLGYDPEVIQLLCEAMDKEEQRGGGAYIPHVIRERYWTQLIHQLKENNRPYQYRNASLEDARTMGGYSQVVVISKNYDGVDTDHWFVYADNHPDCEDCRYLVWEWVTENGNRTTWKP